VDAEEAVVAAFVGKLVTMGQLTFDDARTVRPILEVRFDDRRGQQITALPGVTDVARGRPHREVAGRGHLRPHRLAGRAEMRANFLCWLRNSVRLLSSIQTRFNRDTTGA
jgi:hypothetical protein